MAKPIKETLIFKGERSVTFFAMVRNKESRKVPTRGDCLLCKGLELCYTILGGR
jgi:hypothetical protein